FCANKPFLPIRSPVLHWKYPRNKGGKHMIGLSILDYSPIDEGATAGDALQQTTALAQLADGLGYKRYWVAEHHQVYSVAGSSPEMLMMHLAGATQRIRIGSGGVMLPHYSS